MEDIFAKIAKDTIKFDVGDDEYWRGQYEPLHESSYEGIARVKDEVYGPAERNRLDVYFPLNDKTEKKPVILFVHGGGFFSGGKEWSEKIWGNVGWFFAKHGYVTVLANHRLVPHVTYPGGAEDMQMAREWIYYNIAAPKYGQGSPEKVILLGHSSGGAHLAMNLYAAGDPKRIPKLPIFPPVAGIIYLSVPFWCDMRKPIRNKVFRSYYGTDDEKVWGPLSALGLFKALPDDSPLLDSTRLPVYIGSVEWEVPETANATVAFFNAYRERSVPTGTLPILQVQEKHNHITNVLSIGTTDTAQGQKLLEFMQSCLAKLDQRKQQALL
ncbi:alpha/beta-hydrolase [Aspergillus transmontanensis]|uniref:Alpha/beta-hydrolase n=1 Tax=Aspergillus transmontanensis TaxID=1034304 RepID=A0A5N6VIT2_9EURO|nr:alpha/beta-hydrolase [Aspergillus transmontanensis]